jgi:hypothetical protein
MTVCTPELENIMQGNISEHSGISTQKVAAAEHFTLWWTFYETLMHPYHLKQV